MTNANVNVHALNILDQEINVSEVEKFSVTPSGNLQYQGPGKMERSRRRKQTRTGTLVKQRLYLSDGACVGSHLTSFEP